MTFLNITEDALLKRLVSFDFLTRILTAVIVRLYLFNNLNVRVWFNTIHSDDGHDIDRINGINSKIRKMKANENSGY